MEGKYHWARARLAAYGRLALILAGFVFFTAFVFVLSAAGVDWNIRILSMHSFRWGAILRLVLCGPAFVLSSLLLIALVPALFVNLVRGNLSLRLCASRREECRPIPVDTEDRYGTYLAKHCRDLDKMAEEVGVTPLRALGTQESGSGEKGWFSAATGLETVNALLEKLAEADCRIVYREELKKDLEMLRAALEKGGDFRLRMD